MGRHASVVTSRSYDVEGAAHPHLRGPRGDARWDASFLWTRTGQDVDRYTLAVARALLLGASNDDELLGWDDESIVGDLWRGMTQELRELVALLAVHGRPIDRMHIERSELVPPGLIGMGTDAFLVEQSRSSLWLAAPTVWLSLLSPADRRERHRQLGEAFARIAHEDGPREMAPLAVLEAHRHFAAVPDVDRAREFARFGVEMLLSTAKKMSIEGRYDPFHYTQAAITYDVVLKLDEQVRTDADPSGIGPSARAYALHYRAYNRYKSGKDRPAETLTAYREALAVWPQNALFWSRTIGCCFVADRYEEGVRARDEAFAKVPPHPQRGAFLVARTVDHLLKRDLVLAAMLVWRDYRADTVVECTVEMELRRRLARGWTERRLWVRGASPVVLRTPVRASITADDGVPTCHLLDLRQQGTSREAAFSAAAQALLSEVLDLVEDPEPAPERVLRRRNLVSLLDLNADRSGDERLRWIAYLASLDDRVASGELTEAQGSRFLSTWRNARRAAPGLRRPSVGRTEDDRLHLSWAFADRPGVVFTVDIEPDGRIDWFYRNATEQSIDGTEDEPEADLPEKALRLLVGFAS
jgi:hypothetical protein